MTPPGVGFLLANGVTMIRKEGRSLGNLLSLLAGLALIAVPVIGVLLVLSRQPVAIAAATFLLLGASYAGMFFLVLLVWSFAYSQLSKRVPSEGIVVLGSGLVRGKVPPLLRGRLDQAISVWRHARTQGHDPVLVPSGGQGSDEPVAEAVAMAEYLREQGVPDDRILVEDRATNTEENLRYSRALLDSAGHDEEMLVVTSNYHVMRAAFLARELGLPAQAVGAPTAAYYLPSAFLREFVAVLSRHKLMHAVVGTMILLVSVAAGLVASWL